MKQFTLKSLMLLLLLLIFLGGVVLLGERLRKVLLHLVQIILRLAVQM